MILYAPSVTKILHSVHLILGSAQNFTFMASSLLDIVLFINSIKFSGFLAKREFLWLIRTCISVWDWRFDPQFSQSMQAIPTPSYIDLIMFSPTLPPYWCRTAGQKQCRGKSTFVLDNTWHTWVSGLCFLIHSCYLQRSEHEGIQTWTHWRSLTEGQVSNLNPQAHKLLR